MDWGGFGGRFENTNRDQCPLVVDGVACLCLAGDASMHSDCVLTMCRNLCGARTVVVGAGVECGALVRQVVLLLCPCVCVFVRCTRIFWWACVVVAPGRRRHSVR